MKKPKISTEKPAPKAKTEQSVVAVATEAKTKKASPTQKDPKQLQALTPKPVPVPNAEAELPDAVVVTAENLKKPSPAPKSPKKSQAAVTKLVRELPEEEKTIHRSIGWLAQEGKISLNTIDRVETIALKE